MMKPIIKELEYWIDPVQVFENIENPRDSVFLESSMDPHKLGRFSILLTRPFMIVSSKKDEILIKDVKRTRRTSGNPFILLKKLIEGFKTDYRAREVPFYAGAAGYFSYDLKNFTEKLPDKAVDDLGIPDLFMGFYNGAIVFDNLERKIYLAAIDIPDARIHKAGEMIEYFEEVVTGAKKMNTEDFENEPARRARFAEASGRRASLESDFTKTSYMRAIAKAKEYIKKGDIYQVNLSQRFTADLGIPAFELYKTLKRINPAPFASFIDLGGVKVVSASPERFLMKRKDTVETRPIKGTRPRGRDAEEDRRLREELKASAKDRAENLMIIDLERNDLGRICEYGSVRVTEFMTIERHPTVFHLVSAVQGRVKKGIGAIDCLFRCFPGGSITGAPKIRAMEIIEELEPVKRNVYTGSIGYIGFNGDMDTSIAIRTFVVKGEKACFSAGGGIVADSDPEAEYDETLDKAKALMEALKEVGSEAVSVY